MRYPSGRISRIEDKLIGVIRARHGINRATPVRLFPRSVDAALLGGLNAAVGELYGSAKSIQGRYRREGARLYVINIKVDGRAAAGRILLSNRRCTKSGV